jgi:hypothetical protein
MDFDEFTKPTLIEPGTKYFLNETLKQTHIFRLKYQNYIINIGLFVFFLLVLGAILLYKYKGRLTEEDKAKKIRKNNNTFSQK